MKTSLLFTTLLSYVYAVPNNPRATSVQDNELSANGYTPRPTDKPHFDLHRRNLDARSLTAGELIGYFGPDNTIGFVAGNGAGGFTCYNDAATAAVAGTAFGCCADTGCRWLDNCYDFPATAACDHDCQVRTDVVLWYVCYLAADWNFVLTWP
jgi:hypothetical protein